MLINLIRIPVIYFILITMQAYAIAPEVIKEKINIKMQDGVELTADRYYPKDTVILPVILIRSPYGKEQYSPIAKMLAENYYIVITQDVRGRGESGGNYIPFVNEASDGLQTLLWIKDQKWYNGKIGMWGASYNAYCACVLAEQNEAALTSVFSISGGTDLNKSLLQGGAFNLMLNMTWIQFSKIHIDTTLRRYKPIDLMNSIPLIDGFRLLKADRDIEYIDKFLGSLNTPVTAQNTVFLHMTGWYDFFNVLTFDEFDKKEKLFLKDNKIIIGPWYHDQIYGKESVAGDEDFGPGAVMGVEKLTELILQWFDYSIKGKQNDFTHQKDVKLFVMGKNTWEEYESFEPAGYEEKILYLTSSGNANTKDGNGKLAENSDSKTPKDSFISDPFNPVPTLGGALFHFFPDLLGVRDQSEIEKRNDVLVYSTEILTDNIKIIGHVKTGLYVSTEGFNADFTAKLVEVKQDGYSKIISDGIIRMGEPNGSKLIPGKIYKIEIDLGYTAIKLPKGSKLRLDISASNFPKYDRNPNTGENPLYAKEFVKAKQTVYYGEEHPSKLIFGIIK